MSTATTAAGVGAGPAASAARWWFEGSTGGPPEGGVALRADSPSLLSRRHWHALGAAQHVPPPDDALCTAMAASSPAQLQVAAALFDVMALVQPPRIDHRWPHLMQLRDARWAASVAAIQPFERRMAWGADAPPGPVRGMLELKPRLEAVRPGLWHRGTQGWPAPQLPLLQGQAGAPAGPSPAAAASDRRALRCWQQCLLRARVGP